jgi:hypothetical protein
MVQGVAKGNMTCVQLLYADARGTIIEIAADGFTAALADARRRSAHKSNEPLAGFAAIHH